MPTERLFFALWPPAEVRDGLVAARAALPDAGGRLSHPADLHLTLVFIGAVDDGLRPCIEAAGDAVRAAPFMLTLDEIGDWPGPRIRWCRPRQVPPPLPALVEDLNARLADCGLPAETRPYRPHVTLARNAPPLSTRPLTPGLDWSVQGFVLAASQPGRRPSYEVLRRWPLG